MIRCNQDSVAYIQGNGFRMCEDHIDAIPEGKRDDLIHHPSGPCDMPVESMTEFRERLMEAPVIRGGQGRSDDEIETQADWWIVVLIVAAAAVLTIAFISIFD